MSAFLFIDSIIGKMLSAFSPIKKLSNNFILICYSFAHIDTYII